MDTCSKSRGKRKFYNINGWDDDVPKEEKPEDQKKVESLLKSLCKNNSGV